VQAGEFRAGEKLPPERELMVRFGVGRNTVREAVQSLVSQGILDVRPGRGTTVLGTDTHYVFKDQTFITMLSNSAIDDLYEFRMLLETESAARAAERATDQQRDAVKDALDRYVEAYRTGGPAYRRDVEFHATVARASNNSAYAAAFDAVAKTLLAAMRATDELPWTVERGCTEHGAVAECILEGNPEGARAAMTLHLQSAQRALAEARELLRKRAVQEMQAADAP
jgi:GntR family transcriptional repressor for pyruvate dehydrogenase complex